MKMIITRTATISMDDNCIIHIVIHKNVHIDYEDSIDNFLVVKTLTSNMPSSKLIDGTSPGWTISKQAINYIMNEDAHGKTIARALIFGDYTARLLATINFFIKSTKTPVKVFSQSDKAIKWLLNFSKE